MIDHGGKGNVLELTVPVILTLDHAPSVELAALQLNRHDMTRSFTGIPRLGLISVKP
ncbi:hypothetical protein F2Q69_00054858 [Brassica cretica]|uniref:Uncharacterized protein n=1 Tax=Brassica cretica TaxID=69181 RepID=A0A8S9MXV1_BRACR|nr:hypothetical protein F2Q69_00054858 [Brassica cretica]